jgi:ABC-type glycerol-3-phosphate transport system substrate-binding protein
MAPRKVLQRLTRRAVLRLAGAALTGLAASACQATVPRVGKAVQELLKTTVTGKGQAARGAQEAIRVIASLQRPLWLVHARELFPTYNVLLRERATTFCREHNWPLNLSYVSEFVGLARDAEKIAAAVRAGSAPDLILHTLPATRLYPFKCLDPVTDLVTELQAKWGKAARRLVRDYYTDAEWWAVPFHQRSAGGWYRTDVWESAGIDIQALRTYPELAEACLRVSNPEKELYGWGVTISRCDSGNAFIDRVITGWGGHWQDESGRYVTIASPETIEAVNWLVDLYTHPHWTKMLPPAVLSWTDVSNNEAYLAGKLAYTQDGGALRAEALLSEHPLAAVTGFHPLAGGPRLKEFHGLGASAWMIPRGSANRDAAQALVQHFMLSLEQLDEVFAAAPAFALPAYAGLWDQSSYLPTNRVATQQRPPATDPDGIIPWLHPGPASPAMALGSAADIRYEMVSSALNGKLAVEAVQAAQERLVGIFQEFGMPGERSEVGPRSSHS